MMRVISEASAVSVYFGDSLLFCHRPDAPAIHVGHGQARFDMYRGNFDIEDYLETREPLAHLEVHAEGEGHRLVFRRHAGDQVQLEAILEPTPEGASLTMHYAAPEINRTWWRLTAEHDERVWGCGEQMSYLNLRGRHFPLWTSEPGVGRDKNTYVTWRSDVENRAGGDYYHTNYPQPTFLSSRRYACHVETSSYADFDFRHGEFHELQVWEVPKRIELFAASSYLALVEMLGARFGHQPRLPEWIYDGVILGLKRGKAHAEEKLEQALAADMAVSALWCEDWAGIRETSFGARLFWDWQASESRYPDLAGWCRELASRGIRFLGYVNPYLCVDGELYPVARENGYLATDGQGGTAVVDFGEFDCGVVDFTNPDACTWFKDTILKANMLDIGISGWMADFGEYLPVDVTLANGVSAEVEHNRWPLRWAKVNAEALAEHGKTADATFFMRAGYTGVQAYCPLLWGGDQSVDFSRHDGIGTVITAALSSGLVGNAFHHSDIGGYTSLFGNVRSSELFKRWVDLAAFTPVMRTHECNRPADNLQWFDSDELVAHLAHMSRVYCHLTPYLRTLVEEGAERGIPVQRPLFLHFEDDPKAYDIQTQYLYGPELLVAPVIEEGAGARDVYLPAGETWVHLWSGRVEAGGRHLEVNAPDGRPPVFFRQDSGWRELFERVPGHD
ncbi:alpha-glucosidase [Halomonas elongata]|uniref:alpha-glucosidase n=1 Tax=Halomonas elongata TaxID=2746 RepID=UPI0021F104C1|nr:alpha-glucosidase [Halomonas elongata]MBW5799722.1 alpha-glucosidase [Halomonas elongata]